MPKKCLRLLLLACVISGSSACIYTNQYSENYSTSGHCGVSNDQVDIGDFFFRIQIKNISPRTYSPTRYNHKGGPFAIEVSLPELEREDVTLIVHSVRIHDPARDRTNTLLTTKERPVMIAFPVKKGQRAAMRGFWVGDKNFQSDFYENQELVVELDVTLRVDGEEIRETVSQSHFGCIFSRQGTFFSV